MLHSFLKALKRLFILGSVMIIAIILLALTPYPWRLLYPLHHRDVIAQEAGRHKTDPSLVAAIINVESSWRQDAVSPKGAKGLMQLMPTTAAWIAGKTNQALNDENELFTPEINIRLGINYLADLLEQFNGDETIAIAAYNGGRGNIKKWLDSGTWDGNHDTVADIPFAETRRYVLKVQTQRGIYRRIYPWP